MVSGKLWIVPTSDELAQDAPERGDAEPQPDPASRCTICRHPQRVMIDQQLERQVSLRTICSRYGLSKTSLLRHRDNHFCRLMADEAEQPPKPGVLGALVEAVQAQMRMDDGADGVTLEEVWASERAVKGGPHECLNKAIHGVQGYWHGGRCVWCARMKGKPRVALQGWQVFGRRARR